MIDYRKAYHDWYIETCKAEDADLRDASRQGIEEMQKLIAAGNRQESLDKMREIIGITRRRALDGMPRAQAFDVYATELSAKARQAGHAIPKLEQLIEDFEKLPKPELQELIKRYPAHAEVKMEAAVQAQIKEKSWANSFRKLPTAGKIAVVGGTVALAGTLGYWAFHARQEQNDGPAAAR